MSVCVRESARNYLMRESVCGVGSEMSVCGWVRDVSVLACQWCSAIKVPWITVEECECHVLSGYSQ